MANPLQTMLGDSPGLLAVVDDDIVHRVLVVRFLVDQDEGFTVIGDDSARERNYLPRVFHCCLGYKVIDALQSERVTDVASGDRIILPVVSLWKLNGRLAISFGIHGFYRHENPVRSFFVDTGLAAWSGTRNVFGFRKI